MYELWKERKRKKLKKQKSPLKNLMFEIASWNRSQKKKQLNLFDVLCESKKNERTENGKGKNVLDEKNLSFMMEITLYDRNITHSCEILQQNTHQDK